MTSLLKLLGLNAAPINKINSFSLGFSWNLAGLILILLIIMPLSYYLYRYEGKNIAKNRKRLVLGLRIAWVALLGFLLAGPSFVISGLIPEKNKIAVVVDTSKSMSIKTSGENDSQETRLDQMKKVFEKGFLDKIESKLDTPPEVFSFSENVSPVSKHEIKSFSLKPEGNHTNISGAISNITNNLGDSNLIGIIMLTDGTSTQGENPLFTTKNIKTPIYFVAPEDKNESSDLALSLVSPPSLGYLNSNIRIKGELNRYKLEEKEFYITVAENSKAIATITASFEGQAAKTDFYFNLPCKEEGSFRYDFTVAQQANELTGDNNTDGFLLKVVRERLNVVALAGRPSMELKFIGNALSADPNINFTQYVRVLENQWISASKQVPQAGRAKQLGAGVLDEADVLIITDLEYKDFKGLEGEAVARLESGLLGLWFMASHRSLAHLGYKGSAILQALPVEIETELLIKSGTGIGLPQRDTEYNFLRLLDDPIQNQDFIETLPKLEGLYEYSKIKPGAEVLLNSKLEKAGMKLPFMLKSQYGRGNVIFTTGGPIWPFGFRLVTSRHGMAPYTAMTVNMAKMLAHRREDASVSIELPYSRGFTEQAIAIKTWVSNHKRELIQNAQVTLVITDENGNQINLTSIETADKGCYESIFIPTNRGIHKILANARLQGKSLGEAKAEILIETSTAEFDNPEVSFELMEKIAQETGGLCVSASEVNKIVDALKVVPGEKLETKKLDPRDSWVLLLLLIILPCLEWYIRRTGGLS